ncbi:hypothetical protein CKAN_01451700 [Cinnamomum micranthum f. kanehirae]|uniref:Uncharacterized protein n=1 Tax=Cinnamomum micranthum f. kanehirae TaxID=337451 RepID=A0A443P4F6_9MAGN|nr:hypothetical protein CKAN_01451700 [Cinnamomum micranthum f. kanehirae]
MTSDTNTLEYWLNWRVLVCAIWVLSPMIAAAILIRNYEGSDATEHESGETQPETTGTLYEDECWKPCLKEIHPAWLLAFRIVAFFILLALLIINIVLDGGGIFYFYTQWTFTLVTIYFGNLDLQLGSLLSIHGCYQVLKSGSDRVNHIMSEAERGTYVAPTLDENVNLNGTVKNSVQREEHYVRRTAGIWGYAFQIIYQTCAGAAMLTDVVFWLIIFPFLTYKAYTLNFLLVGMHSLNVVFLLAVPMVPNLLLYPVDSYVCHLPMDDPFLHLNMVAISISRLVIPFCSDMVLIGGSAAPSMLCHLCIDRKDEKLLPVEMVSSVIPVFKVNRGFQHHQCHNLFELLP